MYKLDIGGLKKHINDSGIKQKVISKKVGISEVQLSLILTGKRKCTAEEYAGICDVLEVDLGKFIEKTKKC